MRLTIQEIAQVKTEKKLNVLTKTHDGTSMGKLRNSLKDFIKQYARIYAVTTNVYDENGELVFESQSPINIPLHNEQTQYIKRNNRENLHYVMNATTRGDANKPILNVGSNERIETLGEWEKSYLTEKNDEGNYLYRSFTLVSTNGSTISLIRNNKFNVEDETKFSEIYDNMVKKCKEYNGDDGYILLDSFKGEFEKVNVKLRIQKKIW